MSDLIDRQAAIDALNKMKIYRPLDSDRYVISDCLNKIVNLPSVQEQRWIPDTEKYPDMDERVLVYTTAHEYHVWDCMSNRGENYFWEDEDGLYHNKYEVELWMPLPEPYKGEK